VLCGCTLGDPLLVGRAGNWPPACCSSEAGKHGAHDIQGGMPGLSVYAVAAYHVRNQVTGPQRVDAGIMHVCGVGSSLGAHDQRCFPCHPALKGCPAMERSGFTVLSRCNEATCVDCWPKKLEEPGAHKEQQRHAAAVLGYQGASSYSGQQCAGAGDWCMHAEPAARSKGCQVCLLLLTRGCLSAGA
jgi:hypothetical protein